jgi:hypothetical protein
VFIAPCHASLGWLHVRAVTADSADVIEANGFHTWPQYDVRRARVDQQAGGFEGARPEAFLAQICAA